LSAKSERLTTELTEAQVKKVDEESSYSVIRVIFAWSMSIV